eukprot:COSAG02_NODE_11935_length_1628_cov_635.321125_1_plen_129_part_00
MSESQGVEINGGQLQDFTIDQLAGASALILGSVGGLLMIIWKSRCACRMRLGFSDKCYIFDCERKPPDEADSDEEDNKKDKKPKDKKPKDKKPKPEPAPEPQEQSPEPEAEPEIENRRLKRRLNNLTK